MYKWYLFTYLPIHVGNPYIDSHVHTYLPMYTIVYAV
jgi:hypothetical protein